MSSMILKQFFDILKQIKNEVIKNSDTNKNICLILKL